MERFFIPDDEGSQSYEAHITCQFDVMTDGSGLQPKWGSHKLLIKAGFLDEAVARAQHAARYLTQRDFGLVFNFRITSTVVTHQCGDVAVEKDEPDNNTNN